MMEMLDDSIWIEESYRHGVKRDNYVILRYEGPSSKPLTLGIEMQNLDFGLLGFGLSFVQYFLTMLLSFSFGNVIYILCR